MHGLNADSGIMEAKDAGGRETGSKGRFKVPAG